MIKVVNIITDSNIGGAGKCVLIYAENHNRNEVELSVIIPKNSLLKKELERLNISTYEADFIADKSFSLKGIFSLIKIIKNIKPDVVHTHGSMSGRIAAKLLGIKKIIYTLHCVYEPSGFMKSFPGKVINKIVAALFSTDIIAVAQAAKDNLTAVGIPDKKINVVLNGISPLERLSNEQKQIQRKRFNVEEGQKVVSIIARLESVKGHKYFIDAVKILREKGCKDKFIVAGVGSFENEIKEYAKSSGVDVEFVGFLNDIHNLVAVTDISANASYGTEATSISLLEGMSLGIPAVVSDYGGNPGVIKDGINGFLFPCKNSVKMAEKLEILLNDEGLYGKMQENSLDIFNKTFTADIYARNIEKIYMK